MKQCLRCRKDYSEELEACPECGSASWMRSSTVDEGPTRSAGRARRETPRRRPIGITVLGVLYIVLGLACAALLVVVACSIRAQGVIRSSQSPVDLPGLLLNFLVCALTVWVGFGLLNLRFWAYGLTFVGSFFLGFGMLSVVLVILFSDWPRASSSGYYVGPLVVGLVHIVQFIYLVRPRVSRVFYPLPEAAGAGRE